MIQTKKQTNQVKNRNKHRKKTRNDITKFFQDKSPLLFFCLLSPARKGNC